MQRELELRAKINTILTEGEQLNESILLGVVGAILAFSSLVVASINAVEQGPGAPLFQLGHGGSTSTDPRKRPAFGYKKAEKRYHAEMVRVLSEAYENALDLSRRFPQAAKVFDMAAGMLKRLIIRSKDYTARELEDASKAVYRWMFDIKRWAEKKQEELEHLGRS